MPVTQVIFYHENDGNARVVDWLRELRRRDPKAWANCLARIELLAQMGHDLRRPAADFLRNGIHELRARKGNVH